MTVNTVAQSSRRQIIQAAKSVVVLFKLRVVALLLLAAVAGAQLGANGAPASNEVIVLVIVGGLTAAGASSLNQYFERERDAQMERTARRPLAIGTIAPPERVLALGIALVSVPTLSVLPFNPPLAFFVALGATIYIGVYTLWLKPRTWLNIVIGGAAGSCAVLSGGAAVGAWADPKVLTLALLVFAWTPVHFWSLALWHRHDYIAVRVPMLPAVTTPRRTGMGILLHALGCGGLTLALAALLRWHLLYLAVGTLATTGLWLQCWQLFKHPDAARAKAVFHTSNLYLGVVLLAGGWAAG